MSKRKSWRVMLALVFITYAALPATAVDLHLLWDQQCLECHGHAGDFARRHLKIVDGRLAGPHRSADLRRFLGQHHMSDGDADRVYAMLLAQVATPPAYQQRCAGCHGTAAEFARKSLEMSDGVLVGQASRRPVADFLARHGGASREEVRIIVDALQRVLAETKG